MNWPPAYTLHTHQKIYKLNESIKFILVSKKSAITFAYIDLPISVLDDPHIFREWFCNSESNRHEICTRLRQRVKIKVSRISPESVKFHFMKLTKMFKLNLKKKSSSPLNLGA